MKHVENAGKKPPTPSQVSSRRPAFGRVEEPLKRCGISTLQQLRDTPAAALKAAVDPQTGSRVLAVVPVEAAGRVAGAGFGSRGAGGRRLRGE